MSWMMSIVWLSGGGEEVKRYRNGSSLNGEAVRGRNEGEEIVG